MTTVIRPINTSDADRVVELSLAAWEPVFSSFREALGPDLYERVHPDWRSAQAASVRDPLGIASALTEHALDEMRARGIDLAIVATGAIQDTRRHDVPTSEQGSPIAHRSGTRRCSEPT